MSETKCSDCEYDAVRTLQGKPYCLKCFEEAKVLLMPDVRFGNYAHARNTHARPLMPLSELRYNGQLAYTL